jgi:hypothetical protein
MARSRWPCTDRVAPTRSKKKTIIIFYKVAVTPTLQQNEIDLASKVGVVKLEAPSLSLTIDQLCLHVRLVMICWGMLLTISNVNFLCCRYVFTRLRFRKLSQPRQQDL